jgi:hypothetical protein
MFVIKDQDLGAGLEFAAVANAGSFASRRGTCGPSSGREAECS